MNDKNKRLHRHKRQHIQEIIFTAELRLQNIIQTKLLLFTTADTHGHLTISLKFYFPLYLK